MQSVRNSFGGYVVLKSVYMAFRDEDNLLNNFIKVEITEKTVPIWLHLTTLWLIQPGTTNL